MSFNIPGVSEWTPEEIKEKDSNVKRGAARRLMSVIESAVPDEFELVDISSDDQEANFAWSLDAQNHLLALLNFPNKLKPYLDSIMGSAAACGTTEFSATHREIGQRSRSGRENCSDESMEKWVYRHKIELEEWMSYKSFQLVKITPGDYDHVKNRRLPTRYRVFLNQYVVKTVNLAKSKYYWRDGAENRRLQGRALREAARTVINEIPDAPNLKIRSVKSLSEQQKFDRNHRSILTYLKKNSAVLDKLGFDVREYLLYLVGEIDKIGTNPRGTIGNLLTPDRDEPNHQISIWNKIQAHELADEIRINDEHLENKIDLQKALRFDPLAYAFQSVQNEEREIAKPKYFRDGKFVDSDHSFAESANPTEETDSVISIELSDPLADIFDDDTNLLKTKDDCRRTSESVSTRTNEETNRTNVSEWVAESDDFFDCLDWKTEAEETQAIEADAWEIIDDWTRLIAEKVPELSYQDKWSKTGKWNVVRQMVTSKARDADASLNTLCTSINDRIKPLSDLKQGYLDWIAVRLEFWQNGYECITESKRQDFLNRLRQKILKLPGEV